MEGAKKKSRKNTPILSALYAYRTFGLSI